MLLFNLCASCSDPWTLGVSFGSTTPAARGCADTPRYTGRRNKDEVMPFVAQCGDSVRLGYALLNEPTVIIVWEQ